MSKSSSSSETASQTSNVSEDNRVVADGSGTVALGKDAIYSVQNELSPNMLGALKEFVSLVRDAGEVVVNTTDKANQQAQNTVAAFTQAIQNDKQGTSTTETTIVKYIPYIIGAVVIVIVIRAFFNRK